MWDSFFEFWGTVSFVGAFFLATFLVSYKIEKQNNWTIKAILSFLLAAFLCHTCMRILVSLSLSRYIDLILRNVICILLFGFAFAAMMYIYKCTTWEALFCCVAGYCMQHLTQRLSLFLADMMFYHPNRMQSAAMLVLVTGLCYFLLFRLFIRNKNYSSIVTDNKPQILITSAVLLTTITLSSFSGMAVNSGNQHTIHLFLYGFSAITASLNLMLEFSLLFKKNAELERDIISQLMHENQVHYAIEKSTIDAINIKCHDLKHQLIRLEQQLDGSLLTDIKKAVNAYDFIFKTGSTALDTVLTMKGLYCESHQVTLTCIADGSNLFFMSEADIYALFGNILDNALEAVLKLDDPDKRLIGLTIKAKNHFLLIHTENYYSGRLSFINGLPQTTKDDTVYHGFGMHSISLLTEKYNGQCKVQADSGIFTLDLMFPMPAEK